MLRSSVRAVGRSSHFCRWTTAWDQEVGCDASASSKAGCRALTARAASSEQESKPLGGRTEKIVAAVVLERLPVVLPLLPKPVADFQSYSFAWRQQYRRAYPEEFLKASSSKEDDGGEMLYEPAATVTEADTKDNRRSLLRALDRRLYLILHGFPFGSSRDKPVWHFPEKQYADEETLRLCAESAVTSFVEDPDNDLYFVGNAPVGHIEQHCLQPGAPVPFFKRFFFKSQFIGNKVNLTGGKHKDFAWVSKEELIEYLEEPHDKDLMKKLLPD